ncbi:MAG TPA: hypothetical protein VI874_02670 [Candidatus Norongarragalinales archaeon]|nr:hypothetical protein [Candidatus Norongarragalinales archaeon]
MSPNRSFTKPGAGLDCGVSEIAELTADATDAASASVAAKANTDNVTKSKPTKSQFRTRTDLQNYLKT